MEKVLILENFRNTVPSHKIEKVQKLCEELERQINEKNIGIQGTTKGSQTRKFRGRNHLFKFRASDGDRIIFTYTKYLKNYREEHGSGICLIEYVSQHDQQNRRARSFDERTAGSVVDDKYREALVLEIENGEDEEYERYEKYLDLDKSIVYVRHEKELAKLFSKNNDSLDAYISNQQFEYVCHMGAAILMGGAGSGKTLVSLHKLNNYNKYHGEKGYFTYSEGLRRKSEKIFKRISTGSNKVEFHTLESFCLDFLELKEKQFIDFLWFKNNFQVIKKSIELPPNINIIDVWAEIRGIIKGYMYSQWIKSFPISFKVINEISRKILENKYRYIKKYNNDGRQIICDDISEARKNEIIKILKEDDEISDRDKKIIFRDMKKIHEISKCFQYEKSTENLDKRLLPLEEYLKLSKELSIYLEEERRVIHALSVNYQEYIDCNNLYDDNDLSGLSIVKLEKQSRKPFQFLVVDEVQDLTELQIYLMYNLVEDKENIFFAGDIHQIINPTYFSTGRLRKLFSLKNKNIEELYLTKNYRSQKNIVNLANELSNIRREYIAKRNEENEQLVQAINEGNRLLYLQRGNDNLKKMLLSINEKANAATIVAEEEDRIYLEKLIGGKSNNIYTVGEIKGLEFEYIFCYNLIGKYSTYWEDIFSEKAKKNAKYRYYFNIFYVSITRAKKYLCIYDEENQLFSKGVFELFHSIEKYNKEALYLEDQDNDPRFWEDRGRELEEADKYDKAILAYKKAKSDNKNILRCEAKIKAKEKNYDSAMKIMMEIGEYKYVKQYAEALGDNSMSILASMLIGEEDYDELERKYGRDSVNQVLVNNIVKEDYRELLNYNYIENYILINMLEDIDNIQKNIEEILGDKHE